jgi:hypothetical protein
MHSNGKNHHHHLGVQKNMSYIHNDINSRSSIHQSIQQISRHLITSAVSSSSLKSRAVGPSIVIKAILTDFPKTP